MKYKTALTAAAWQPLTSSNTNDNGTTRTVTDLSATGGQRFYHVEITKP